MDEAEDDGVLSVQLLKSKSNEFDIASIHTISLTQLNLTDISAIGGCIALERLDLSNNSISQLHSLSTLANLLALNLSSNRITSLSGLECLDKLQKLDLSGNLIGGVDGLKPLISHHSLLSLTLHDKLRDASNPLCMKQGYKFHVLKLLPKINTLDDEIVQGPDSEVFQMLAALEKDIACRPSLGPNPAETSSLDIPDDLFVVKGSSEPLENSAEQTWRSIIQENERLTNRSAKLIAQAEQKLRANETV